MNDRLLPHHRPRWAWGAALLIVSLFAPSPAIAGYGESWPGEGGFFDSEDADSPDDIFAPPRFSEGIEPKEAPPAEKNQPPEPIGKAGSSNTPAPLPKLTPEQIESALQVLRDFRPGFAQRIDRHRATKPEVVKKLVAKLWPKIRHLVKIHQDSPRVYELRLRQEESKRETKLLVARFRAATTENEKQSISKQLRSNLRAILQLRQQIKEHELKNYEQKLETMRQHLILQRESLDQRVEQKFAEITAPRDR